MVEQKYESVTVNEIEASEKKPSAYYQSRDSGVIYAWYKDDTVKIVVPVKSVPEVMKPSGWRRIMDFFRSRKS
jgi:uncharacterized circularly permuted ATP-grasp superfamily protein